MRYKYFSFKMISMHMKDRNCLHKSCLRGEWLYTEEYCFVISRPILHPAGNWWHFIHFHAPGGREPSLLSTCEILGIGPGASQVMFLLILSAVQLSYFSQFQMRKTEANSVLYTYQVLSTLHWGVAVRSEVSSGSLPESESLLCPFVALWSWREYYVCKPQFPQA